MIIRRILRGFEISSIGFCQAQSTRFVLGRNSRSFFESSFKLRVEDKIKILQDLCLVK